MARSIDKLSPLKVVRAQKKGMYPDGGGLYLQVTESGVKTWVYRFMIDGRARAMGLGPLHTVSLSDARKKAVECRKLRLDGIDPIDARKEGTLKARLEAAKAVT